MTPNMTPNNPQTNEVVKYEELVVIQLSSWRTKLVERYFMYDEISKLRTKNPKLVIDTQQGKVPIQTICEVRWGSLREAVDIVDVLEEMKKKLEAGDSVIVDEARNWTKTMPSFIQLN